MKNGGFTLVEVVVVGVIVAIIATTATMLYGGYVQDSAKSTVTGLTQTAASSANAYLRRTQSIPDSAALNLFLPEPARYSVSVRSADTSVKITDNRYSVSDSVSFR